MNIELKKQMEQAQKERNRSEYNKIIEANIKLVNQLNWIKEDIQREIYKLKYTYIDGKITKEEIINDLEQIIKVNN